MDPQELERILERLRQGFTLTADELDKLAAAEKNATSITKEFSKATATATKNLASGLGRAAQDARKSGGKISALGGVVDALGDVGGVVSKTFGKLTKGVGNFALNELQDVINEFDTLASVGVTTGAGISGLADQASNARLTLGEFARVMTRNSQGLAFATGTTLQASEALVGMQRAAKPFEQEFRNLGIGFEEQADFLAESAQVQARLGRNQGRDYQALARFARNYADELQTLTRLTGLSVEESKRALESVQSDPRFNIFLRRLNATGEGGEKLGQELSLLAGLIGTRMNPEIQEGFQDLFVDAGTGAAQRFAAFIGTDLHNALMSGQIDITTAFNTIKRRLEQVGEQLPIANLAKVDDALTPFIVGINRAAQGAELEADEVARARKELEKSKKPQDAMTEQVRTAEESVRLMALEIDKLIRQDVLPLAVDMIALLAKHTESAANLIIGAARKLVNGIDYLLGDTTTSPGQMRSRQRPEPRPEDYKPDIKGGRMPGRASGGPITGGKPYMVGEVGPELIVPGASGTVISNKDIQDRLKIINDNLGATLAEGLKTAFLPGIGEVVSYQMGGLTKTMIKNFAGQVEEYARYGDPTSGITMEAYKAGGQTFARGGAVLGDYKVDTGFRPTGGPSNIYRQALASVPEVASVAGVGGTGQGTNVTGANEQGQKLLEQMTAALKQIAETSAASQNTQQQMLRAYSS
jgi:hypothetical protein